MSMACCPTGDSAVSPNVKYLLFFFNFLFWLCGGIMVSVGIWAYIEKNKYYYQEIETIYDIFLDLSILLIIVGTVTFIVGYAGCVGALRENLFLIKIFYCIIFLIFLGEVAIAVLAFIFKAKVRGYVTGVLEEGMILRYQDDEDALMDWFQENIKCCGITGYTDWERNIYFNCSKTNPSGLRCSVPYSCCRDPDALTPGVPNILCGGGALDTSSSFDSSSHIFTIGCVDALVNLAEANLPMVAGIVLGLGVPQLIGICLGRLLSNQIQDQKERWRRR